jgi:hypothetical protein
MKTVPVRLCRHVRFRGLPNLITLVVTSSQARIDTMKDLIMRETKGKGAAHIAFAIIPVLEDPFKSAKPMPEPYTQRWQRAGRPDLFLTTASPSKDHREFDPAAFASKLAFTHEVAELGSSEEDAERLQIGFTRGKVYFPSATKTEALPGIVVMETDNSKCRRSVLAPTL